MMCFIITCKHNGPVGCTYTQQSVILLLTATYWLVQLDVTVPLLSGLIALTVHLNTLKEILQYKPSSTLSEMMSYFGFTVWKEIVWCEQRLKSTQVVVL